jgi:hypothetical protein
MCYYDFFDHDAITAKRRNAPHRAVLLQNISSGSKTIETSIAFSIRSSLSISILQDEPVICNADDMNSIY